MTTDFNNIKQWLLPKLDRIPLSIEMFSREVGVSRAIIYRYLSDQSRPESQTMVRMCRVLGVPFSEGLAQYTPKRVGRPRK